MKLSRHGLKPMFCIDITSSKKNDILNGAEFITKTVSEERMAEFENKQEALEETVNKSKLPLALRIIKYICNLYFLICLVGCIKAGLDKAISNAPVLVLSGVVSGIVWVALEIASRSKQNKVLAEENANEQTDAIVDDAEALQRELDVPLNAAEVDVIGFRYKVMKDGDIRPQTPIFQNTAFVNVGLKLFATGDEVHIADLDSVYSFKKEELLGIATIDKRIMLSSWNKEEGLKEGRFAEYKLSENKYGNVFVKPYHILEIRREGRNYGILFPAYELPLFEKATGLTANRQ